MVLPLSVESIFGPILKLIFKPKNYSNEVNKVVETFPIATIKLWQRMKASFIPTPSKFHYIFNMRELSRVFKGIC